MGIKREHKNNHGDRIETACMSWYEAVQLCNKLSVKNGLSPCYAIDGNPDADTRKKEPKENDVAFWNSITCDFCANGYRLPTLAELKYLAQAKDIFSVNFSNEISAYLCWDRMSVLKTEQATETVVDPMTNKTETSERDVWLSELSNYDGTLSQGGISAAIDSNRWSVYLVRSIPVERITEEQKAEIFENIAKAKAEAEAKAKAERLAAQKQKTLGYADDLVAYKKTMLAKTVVPQEAFEFIMDYNPSEKQGERYAVTNVNFYEIMVFCNRLSIFAGLTPVYSINKSTDPDDWGGIPAEDNSVWNKYKLDKKANGFKLSDYDCRSGKLAKATTGSEFSLNLGRLYIYNGYTWLEAANFQKDDKASFRIMRNK